MEKFQVFNAFVLGVSVSFVLLLWKLVYYCWVLPSLKDREMRANGLGGPKPCFPFGNGKEMRSKSSATSVGGPSISHDFHSTTFPYFAQWQKLHGKVFVYWIGTEPFLYIADPEFLKKMSAGVLGKDWGKPRVFKNDRFPLFGNGLIMTEGDEWMHHRTVINRAFSPLNLKNMTSTMVETAKSMIDGWASLIKSGISEIDVVPHITRTAGEIIAKASFGVKNETGREVMRKLRQLQAVLFMSPNAYTGVPFGILLSPLRTMEANKLGKEIDSLLMSIVESRKRLDGWEDTGNDLLTLLLRDNQVQGSSSMRLSMKDIVHESKTFFFGGHETTALAISWTMLLLALHPNWQIQLRDEIKQVIGDAEIDANNLAALKKMGWVLNEALRLYPSAPNAQRQVKQDMKVGNVVIPKGTNIWIDLVSFHHDKEFWGENAHQFEPERFKDDPNGGCKSKMGYIPFGYGGRMCIGRNLSALEYKVVLTLILTSFSFSLSSGYQHSPTTLLSLRPAKGLQLILQPLSY